GPSHLETYDLKPAAPGEYRSVFRPTASGVPGLDLCEHFPRQARLADKLALVRSVHHAMTSHSDGGIEVLTGKTPARPDPTSTSAWPRRAPPSSPSSSTRRGPARSGPTGTTTSSTPAGPATSPSTCAGACPTSTRPCRG